MRDSTTATIERLRAAGLGITHGLATSYLEYSRAMRLRLPRVGALLVAGDIDYRTFQTIVYRTDLIVDPEVLTSVDTTIAVKVPRWVGITQGRLGGYVDAVVARRADLRHHTRQCGAVPRTLRTDGRARTAVRPFALCGPGRDDAQASADPRPEPGQLHRHRTPPQPGGTTADP